MVLANTHIIHQTDFVASFSEVAITIVFFALGLEENVANFMTGIRKSWGIAFIGALVPFLIGFGCMFVFWPGVDSKVALMGGLAVTATAVSLTMISLKSVGLATSKPAIGIMTSAVLDDIASLALVAICVPIATGEADPTVAGILFIMSKSLLLFAVIIIAHLFVFPHDAETGLVSYIPGLRKYGIRHFLKFSHGEQATLISILIGLFFGMVAVWLGFHQTIGAYLAGLILEERYFDLDEDDEASTMEGGSVRKKNTYDHTLHTIEDAAYCWFGPIFFVNLGATIPLQMDVIGDTILYSLILFVALGIGQFLSAAGAARYVPGGFTWAESCMIGIGMLGRAELFFVVLNISYNDNKIMNVNQFFTFTTTAVLLDISVPVLIALYKPWYIVYVERDREAEELAKVAHNDGPNMTRSATEKLTGWLHMKANRRDMKNERRVFKPEEPGHRVNSKDSKLSSGSRRVVKLEEPGHRVNSKDSKLSSGSRNF
eukprot:TRINITY_DN7602_c0_g1_i3.p1 TRINITY_DN7602_c0_g1~~TRINITY_DN7602_c0_g1_i3.p1  ORF type:complete len:548 (+),score=66.58 TRINITY_DN7602_c0_g1_i3:185-1645(+)